MPSGGRREVVARLRRQRGVRPEFVLQLVLQRRAGVMVRRKREVVRDRQLQDRSAEAVLVRARLLEPDGVVVRVQYLRLLMAEAQTVDPRFAAPGQAHDVGHRRLEMGTPLRRI